MVFLGISGVGMLIGGVFYGRVAKKQTVSTSDLTLMRLPVVKGTGLR
jgi:hypothetical protein